MGMKVLIDDFILFLFKARRMFETVVGFMHIETIKAVSHFLETVFINKQVDYIEWSRTYWKFISIVVIML